MKLDSILIGIIFYFSLNWVVYWVRENYILYRKSHPHLSRNKVIKHIIKNCWLVCLMVILLYISFVWYEVSQI